MTKAWLQLPVVVGATVMAATAIANTARAEPDSTPVPVPAPGIEINDGGGRCTASFAAQGNDGNYYLLTSGHCDPHDGSAWTYGQDMPLGTITASEKLGERKDAAIIRLDHSVGAPLGDVGGRYAVRDVLNRKQIKVGMPFCKIGAATGETCGAITKFDGDVVEASVYSLDGDSGSPGFVTNADGTVSAVGILMSSPDGDDNTTYFTIVDPLLSKWGLRILP
ncbi:MAG: S1 family peptidase [Mycobacterium sp.]